MSNPSIRIDYEQATSYGITYPNIALAYTVEEAEAYADRRAEEGIPRDFRLGLSRAVVVRVDGLVVYRKSLVKESVRD